jgi:hypothetical protein
LRAYITTCAAKFYFVSPDHADFPSNPGISRIFPPQAALNTNLCAVHQYLVPFLPPFNVTPLILQAKLPALSVQPTLWGLPTTFPGWPWLFL